MKYFYSLSFLYLFFAIASGGSSFQVSSYASQIVILESTISASPSSSSNVFQASTNSLGGDTSVLSLFLFQLSPFNYSYPIIRNFTFQFTVSSVSGVCTGVALVMADLSLSYLWNSSQINSNQGWTSSPWSSIFSVISKPSQVLSSPYLLGSLNFGSNPTSGTTYSMFLNSSALNPITNSTFNLVFYFTSGTSGSLFSGNVSQNSPLLAINGTYSVCGDGIVDPGEQCDSGPNVTLNCTYGLRNCTVCNSTCQYQPGIPAYCGDGIVERPYEQCDSGPNVTLTCTYGLRNCTVCNSTCQYQPGIPAYCGDGIVERPYEQCDTGGIQMPPCTYNNKTCIFNYCNATTCQLMNSTVGYCGDGIVERPYEQCDSGSNVTLTCTYGLKNCTVCNSTCQYQPGIPAYCGDGIVEKPYEQCDPGPTPNLNCAYGLKNCTVCNQSCDLVPGITSYCGDGKIDVLNGEQCDGGSNCNSNCQLIQSLLSSKSSLDLILGAAIGGGGGLLLILCCIIITICIVKRKKGHSKKSSPTAQIEMGERKKKGKKGSSSSVSYSY